MARCKMTTARDIESHSHSKTNSKKLTDEYLYDPRYNRYTQVPPFNHYPDEIADDDALFDRVFAEDNSLNDLSTLSGSDYARLVSLVCTYGETIFMSTSPTARTSASSRRTTSRRTGAATRVTARAL